MAARERIDELFDIQRVTGRAVPPPEMAPWLRSHFGSEHAVQEQTIVRIRNRWSGEGTLFSSLRARRPIDPGPPAPLIAFEECSFCQAETGTPAEPWGRVRSEHAVSGANAAKYDGQHGVLVFDRHDPLAFDEATIVDLLSLGRAWAERAHEADPEASAYLLIWNCGQRAGGSIEHGHAQVLLGRLPHYARVERLRRDAAAYASARGHAYLDDLVAAHADLGLSIEATAGVHVLASLTPVKERELLIVGPPGSDERDDGFALTLARTVVAYRDVLGARAFNLALWRAPLDPRLAGRDGWDQIGPVVHLVDRGTPGSVASDIGAMELYAASVVGSDPFDTIAQLRATFQDTAIPMERSDP